MLSVLIIVPTKNSTKYLGKLVSSLLDQNDPNWRVIFIDFNSEKFHKNNLKKICKLDNRFSMVNQISNNGIYGAQNIGFEFCNNNEWMFFLYAFFYIFLGGPCFVPLCFLGVPCVCLVFA